MGRPFFFCYFSCRKVCRYKMFSYFCDENTSHVLKEDEKKFSPMHAGLNGRYYQLF